MGEIWIKEAERLGKGTIGGAMDSPSAPGRVVWHTTESGHGDASFVNVGKYLSDEAYEPHILYDPTTDRLGQYGPLNQSARALKNDGITRTNRTGKVCIQVEVLAKAATPFTGYWKPGPNFRALMRAIRSWGVPDVFPMGALAGRYADPAAKRDRNIWATKGGHYGHCNIPGNDHWDPGNISKTALFAAAPVTSTKPPTTTPTKPATKPSVSVAHLNAARAKDIPAATGHTTYKAEVLVFENALVAEGLLSKSYADGSFGTLTQTAYDAFRRKVGYTGSAATGTVGLESLKKLAAKHNFTAKA
ncbi:peptidoglycan-binding protein LysM [Streptomyces sp. NPDC004528]|uniref:peptidoglycan-binding protein LysM n=1 Tax=Streptomyces sp. NPDC004528 TaxID=3154550 RepID=UPI0033A07F29